VSRLHTPMMLLVIVGLSACGKAETPWVLWSQEPGQGWHVNSTFEARAACVRQLTRRVDAWTEPPAEDPQRPRAEVFREVEGEETTRTVRFVERVWVEPPSPWGITDEELAKRQTRGDDVSGFRVLEPRVVWTGRLHCLPTGTEPR
jgi:hypothetical protein